MAVPAEAAGYAVAFHGLIAGDDILDRAGEQVAVVGQAGGKRRAVVDSKYRFILSSLYGAFENAVFLPEFQDPLLPFIKTFVGYFFKHKGRLYRFFPKSLHNK